MSSPTLKFWWSIREIPHDKQTKKDCEAAIKLDGAALQYINPQLITSSLVKKAITSNSSSIQWVPRRFQTSTTIALVLQDNPKNIRYLDFDIITEKNWKYALDYDEDTFTFFPLEKITPSLALFLFDLFRHRMRHNYRLRYLTIPVSWWTCKFLIGEEGFQISELKNTPTFFERAYSVLQESVFQQNFSEKWTSQIWQVIIFLYSKNLSKLNVEKISSGIIY